MRIDKEGKEALSMLSKVLYERGKIYESISLNMASAYRIAALEITMLIHKFEEIKDDRTEPEQDKP